MSKEILELALLESPPNYLFSHSTELSPCNHSFICKCSIVPRTNIFLLFLSLSQRYYPSSLVAVLEVSLKIPDKQFRTKTDEYIAAVEPIFNDNVKCPGEGYAQKVNSSMQKLPHREKEMRLGEADLWILC